MRGFQPRSAAGAKEQRFADGGFVQGIKRAFGMDEERNAQIAAYRARAAAEKAQAAQQQQAQQTPQPQQRAVTQYSGMSATQRREKELGLADGGRVRPRGFVAGKGTATSDSIPARLSNGEYVLPADTVRAVGVEALDALRESTHQPVKGEQANAARGFFAGGTPGGVGTWFQDQEREQEQRKQEALAAGQAAEAATQAAAVTPMATQQAPAVAPAAPSTSPSTPYKQDRARWEDNLDELQNPTPYRGQVGNLFLQPSGTAAQVAAIRPGVYRGDAGRGTVNPPAVAPQNTTQPESASTSLAGAGRGTVNPPMANPSAPAPSNAPAAAPEVMPGVYRHGRGQYSDNPNGMNMPEGFTGRPSAQNDAILQRMSDQSQAESMARLGFGPQAQYAAEVQRAKNINADEAARNNSVGARMQRLSDPFSIEGRAMRNLQMDIDSSVDRKGRPTGETQALLEKQKAMVGGYIAEPAQQATIAGQLQREGMQQAGETQRTGIRAALDQQRINQSGEELGMKREDQGFQTRAAKRRESAYDNYSKAKTDEDRQAIAKQFPDLFGQAKDAAHRMEVVRGKTDPMTGQSSGDYVVVQDPRTGDVRQIQMGAASAAPTQALPKAGEVRNGFRFKGGNPNDQANWTKV